MLGCNFWKIVVMLCFGVGFCKLEVLVFVINCKLKVLIFGYQW